MYRGISVCNNEHSLSNFGVGGQVSVDDQTLHCPDRCYLWQNEHELSNDFAIFGGFAAISNLRDEKKKTASDFGVFFFREPLTRMFKEDLETKFPEIDNFFKKILKNFSQK